MNGALEILRRERDDAAEQIRLLRVRIKDLDAAISLLEGQPASAKNGRATGDLKLSVLKKLDEAGIAGGTPKELADKLTSEGRQTSDASVSSTLSRLKAESKVANRNGRWFAVNGLSDSQNGESKSPDKDGFDPFGGWDDSDEDIPF
jgi:hypothetical protein